MREPETLVRGSFTAAILTLLLSGAWLPAQDRADHPPGVVVPCDFNFDGFDDALVLSGGRCHAWEGAAEFPWLSQSLTSEVPAQRLVGRPLVTAAPREDAHLFVTSLGPPSDPRCRVTIHEVGSEGGLSAGETVVYALAATGHRGASPRVAVVQPGRCLFVWAEVEPGSEGFLRAAEVTASGSRAAVDLPLPRPVPWGGWRVAAVQPAPAMLAAPGALTVVLTGLADSWALLSVDGATQRVLGSRVFAGLPRLGGDSPSGRRDPAQLGAFAPTPVLGVPTLWLPEHGLLTLHPGVDAPFVHPSGALLPLSRQAHVLPAARADFDRDGAEEVVVLERGPPGGGFDLLAVLDPHPYRREAQAWRIPAGAGDLWGYDFHVYDAAALDVDGDGLRDLAVSTVDPRNRARQSRVSVFLGRAAATGPWFTFHW